MTACIPRLTFFCELDPNELTELFADGAIVQQLAALGAGVSLGIRDLSPARAAVVRRLNRAGIPLIAWQLLPDEHGYWYNQGNADWAAARYAAFLAWTQTHGLHWAGVGVDLEPDIREVARWFANPLRLVPGLARRLLAHATIRRTRASYSALIDRMRGDGYRVESYIIPLMRDERLIGSTLLQRLAGLVDLATDREVPMLYTSFQRPHGPGILWSYAAEVSAAAIGSTGGGVTVGGIDRIAPLTWEELSRDLRLARRWCSDLYIFSLEGCVRQGFLERLVCFDWDGQVALPADQARRVRWARTALRALLWLSAHPYLNWMGVLVLGWAVSRRLLRGPSEFLMRIRCILLQLVRSSGHNSFVA